jgi:hypothetical protein
MPLAGVRRRMLAAGGGRQCVRAAIVGLFAVASVLTPPMGGTGAEAVFPGTNGRIAFAMSSSQTGPDIWTIRPDGSGLRQLTRGGVSNGPRWAPSGRQIAFVRAVPSRGTSDVWVMRPDGTGGRRIATGASGPPAWSPYGDELIVIRAAGSGTDLFRVPLTGGQGQRLTFSGSRGCGVEHPSWRGSLVVYSLDCPDTEQLRLLDLSNARNRLVLGTPDRDGDISWPDFTADMRIIFMSCGFEGPNLCSSESVTTIRRDGTGLAVVLGFCGCESEPSARHVAPAPDGSHFALIVDEASDGGDPLTGGAFVSVFEGRDGGAICCAGNQNERIPSQPDWQRQPT